MTKSSEIQEKMDPSEERTRELDRVCICACEEEEGTTHVCKDAPKFEWIGTG